MSAHETVITINLTEIEQLFNTLDPSPFYERDLDDEAERFIFGSAREAGTGTPFRLIVTIPQEEANSPGAQHLPDAIRNYFGYRAVQARQELRELVRIGWRSLLIGAAVLVLCLSAVNRVQSALAGSAFANFAEQSLAILGWVANWRPLEIFLYEWWPIRRRIGLLEKLARMPVELRTAAA